MLSFFLLIILLMANGFAQDRTTLEKKRENLLREIRETEKMLNKTRSDAKATAADIATLRHKISLREELIDNLEAEVRTIRNEVSSHETSIRDLHQQIEKLKENYAASVYNSYKYQKTNQQLLFILGAENVNQAVRRLNYLRKINQRRKEQASDIRHAARTLEEKVAELQTMMGEKKALLAENQLQMSSLEAERKEKDQFVARLQRNESSYRADIKKKEDEAKKLEKEIRLIIERELAARETSTSDGLDRTPEAIAALSREFYSNRGKLPWPVERGYVSKKFGRYNHPELANLEVNNTGIDIRTSTEAPVRAIFGGEVVSVFSNPTFKNAVIIKHGEYFTVYTKLGSVKVRKGDSVDTRELIGYAYSEGDLTEVHLEVWKGKTNLDPYTWIVKK